MDCTCFVEVHARISARCIYLGRRCFVPGSSARTLSEASTYKQHDREEYANKSQGNWQVRRTNLPLPGTHSRTHSGFGENRGKPATGYPASGDFARFADVPVPEYAESGSRRSSSPPGQEVRGDTETSSDTSDMSP